MGGQGGYAGRVESQALGLGALEKGYAVAGTDTGHVGPGGATDGSWALGNLERVVNYGHAAIHRVTATAKAVVQARYGRAADKAYFAGCSNGGRQALMSAQRYPDDFDAILAGAPAQDIRGVIATFLTIDARDVSRPGAGEHADAVDRGSNRRCRRRCWRSAMPPTASPTACSAIRPPARSI